MLRNLILGFAIQKTPNFRINVEYKLQLSIINIDNDTNRQ